MTMPGFHPSLCMVVIPAKAGRSAKRGERPKDGPEGVSEANHPSLLFASEQMDSSLLKAEHIHVLSPRACFRGNYGHGGTSHQRIVRCNKTPRLPLPQARIQATMRNQFRMRPRFHHL